MLKRTVALEMFVNVLWNMMLQTETAATHNKDQCLGIILDVEPLIKSNKIYAIKSLRDRINNKECIVLPNNLGSVIRTALNEHGYMWSKTDKEIVFQSGKSFSLKEAKDFIDLMETVLAQTEPKAF